MKEMPNDIHLKIQKMKDQFELYQNELLKLQKILLYIDFLKHIVEKSIPY